MPTHNHPDIDLIREALAGECSQEEMDSIRTRLANDPDFKAAYRHCQWEIAILKAAERAALKDQLREESNHSSGRIIPLWAWTISLAAVILILILALRPDPISPRELALSLVIPVSSGQIRGEMETGSGHAAYNKQHWLEAIDLWESQDHLSNRETLLLGSAYLQEEMYQKAGQIFSGLTGDPVFKDVSSWNYCLVLILQGKTEKARPLLEEIAGSSHYQRSEAEKLLDLIR